MTKNNKKISRVLFIGSKKLGLQCLDLLEQLNREALLGAVTIDDREDSRSVFFDFKKLCFKKKIKLFVTKNKKEFNQTIKKLKPDFCIVAGWYWLIDNEILSLIPHGSVGLHGSLLPKYRGGSPAVWAVINGEKETGISLFSFADGMDNGEIWAQVRVPIKGDDYIGDVLTEIENASLDILKNNYYKILRHKIKPKKQDQSKATYCAQRIPEDGLIDWKKPSIDIYNLIRAQSEPYPGAFTIFNGKKLIIWRAKPSKLVYYGTPGQVAKIAKEGVYIICGDQKPIILETVQLEHEDKVSAKEIIKSIKIRFK